MCARVYAHHPSSSEGTGVEGGARAARNDRACAHLTVYGAVVRLKSHLHTHTHTHVLLKVVCVYEREVNRFEICTHKIFPLNNCVCL